MQFKCVWGEVITSQTCLGCKLDMHNSYFLLASQACLGCKLGGALGGSQICTGCKLNMPYTNTWAQTIDHVIDIMLKLPHISSQTKTLVELDSKVKALKLICLNP